MHKKLTSQLKQIEHLPLEKLQEKYRNLLTMYNMASNQRIKDLNTIHQLQSKSIKENETTN